MTMCIFEKQRHGGRLGISAVRPSLCQVGLSVVIPHLSKPLSASISRSGEQAQREIIRL